MTAADDAVTLACATLLRGPLYALNQPKAWLALRQHTARVRDHLHLIGVRVLVDETEEYAWLVQRDDLPDDTPKLMRRHRLSYGVTVMLVSLRQAMLQEETQGAVERFVFSGDAIIEMTRPLHPDSTSDDTLRGDLGKLADMGYVRRIQGSGDDWEALRIIKAHVTADWIAVNAERLRAMARGGDVRAATDPNMTDPNAAPADAGPAGVVPVLPLAPPSGADGIDRAGTDTELAIDEGADDDHAASTDSTDTLLHPNLTDEDSQS